MNIGQKQHLSNLRFYLYDRPLHPELFDIYADRVVVQDAYEAQIWVTGCSHVIGVFGRDGRLVEVTADAETMLPQRGLLLELPFRGERDHEVKRAGGINYMMNFQVETMSRTVFGRTHHELAKMGAQRGLFVPFPTWRSHSLVPFTYIDFQARPKELHVFTFHALPEDLTILKTQSIFEIA